MQKPYSNVTCSGGDLPGSRGIPTPSPPPSVGSVALMTWIACLVVVVFAVDSSRRQLHLVRKGKKRQRRLATLSAFFQLLSDLLRQHYLRS